MRIRMAGIPGRCPKPAVLPRSGAYGGQALVEFALVAPVFFLILFAIIQLGLVFGGQNGLVNAVRDTARYASTYRVVETADAQAACSLVDTQLTTNLQHQLIGFNPTGTTYSRQVTYTWISQPDGSEFVQITVRAAYKYSLYVPIVAAILDRSDGTVDGKLQLSAQEEMRIENNPLSPPAPSPLVCFP
jgi:Flp pilus assembly protein TadG